MQMIDISSNQFANKPQIMSTAQPYLALKLKFWVARLYLCFEHKSDKCELA